VKVFAIHIGQPDQGTAILYEMYHWVTLGASRDPFVEIQEGLVFRAVIVRTLAFQQLL
jgi:hypothetical protein